LYRYLTEHAHSITFQEVSISWKMMVALVINTALLPLFMGADIKELRLVPFLFQGDYPDVTSEWWGLYKPASSSPIA
jgi:hypothetical protein